LGQALGWLSDFARRLAARAREYLRKLAATRHSIGARLLIGILLFSTFVTFVLAGIQLYTDYQRDVAAIQSRLDLIGKSYLDSLAESLWTLDETQLRLQLMGILQQADIRAAEVRDTGISIKPLVVQVGETPEPPVVTRDYPLTHTVQGQDRVIGTLRVEATLANAYRRLTETAARVFATQATEIFLVALFIIFFFNYLVTRHLSAIAAQVGSYRIYDSPLELCLKRRRPRHDDEMQRVTTAFNSLSQNLHAAFRDLAEREARIRCLVDANIIGVFTWQLVGRTPEDQDVAFRGVNDAFLRIVGYDREDLVNGPVTQRTLTAPEWQDRTQRAMAEMRLTGAFQPYEEEYIRKDGSRVPVLIGAAQFGETGEQGVAFVLDLTERKRGEQALQQAQAELAHAARIATMGQLTASIAHEVKQPIAAAVTNAEAALRWLARRPPDLEEVRKALTRIVQDGNRASDVIGRIRDLVRKAPSPKERFEINGAIREVIEITRGEAVKNGVSVRMELGAGLQLIEGDRVQLQQVILNLMMNALEAMAGMVEGQRELQVTTTAEPEGVRVAVRDSGPGLTPVAEERLFEAFHTTKSSGLGIGLSICRSIIEAHGGRLWAEANERQGAVFQFTLPVEQHSAS
jgi:PAS domain S-box-containing protein